MDSTEILSERQVFSSIRRESIAAINTAMHQPDYLNNKSDNFTERLRRVSIFIETGDPFAAITRGQNASNDWNSDDSDGIEDQASCKLAEALSTCAAARIP